MIRDRKTFETKMKTKDHKTQYAYKITLDSFEEWLHGRKIDQENAEDIVQEYVNWFSIDAYNHRMKKKGHSPNTVWNYYTRIKKYLKHLKIIVDEIKLPAKHEKELYPLKLSDIHTIFQSIRYDTRRFLVVKLVQVLK